MTRRSLTHVAAMLLFLLLTGCSGEKPEAFVASAKGLLAKNDTNAAIIQLKNALQRNPDLAEARFLLGKAALETGDLPGAQKELRKALELKYSPDDAIPPLAEAMLRSGEFKKVIDEFGKAGAKAPEAPAADLPAPLAAAMQQLGVAKKKADQSDTVVVTAPEARAALQTTVGKAQLALKNAEAAGAAFAAALAAKGDYPPALLGQAMLAAGKGDLPGALLLLGSALEKSPKLVEGWEFQGQIQLGQGQQEDALASYRKALEAKRDYLPAHAAIVSLLAEQGKLEEASKQLDALRTFAPKHPQTLYWQARLAYSGKQYAAARESIQQQLAVEPGNRAGLLLASAIDFQLKSYTQAEANLLKVLQQDPKRGFARRLLVQTYLRMNRPDKALAAMQPMLGDPKLDANSLSLVAEVYMQSGDMVKAVPYFEKAAASDPTSAGKRTAVALAHVAAGSDERGFKELEEAAPADTGVRADIALIAGYMRQRKFDAALTAVATLEKKLPNSPMPHNLRAGVLLAKDDVAGARRSFEQALLIDPAYFQAIVNLAHMDVAKGKPEEAKKRFEAVLAKDPKNVPALLALAGMRAQYGGTPEEIVKLILRALAAEPNNPRPRVSLIAYYVQSKQPKLAVTAAQEALAIQPDQPEIMDAAARAYWAAGDTNQALKTYAKLTRLQPTAPMPLMRMAELQVATKDYDAALDSVRKALVIQPDLVEAQRLAIALDLNSGKEPAALSTARDMQKQRREDAVGYLLEGDIRVRSKAWSEAAAAYRAGLKNVDSTELAIRLSQALESGNNSAEAEKFAASWLKAHPKDVLFRHFMSEKAILKKDYASAAKQYKELLEIQPNDALALNNLAGIAGQLKDPKAIEYAEKADRVAPNSPAIMDTLGMLLVERGETKRGVELLQKASGLAPEAAAIRLNLARALVKDGQKGLAKKELDVLAQLGDKFAGQAEVTMLMQGL